MHTHHTYMHVYMSMHMYMCMHNVLLHVHVHPSNLNVTPQATWLA